MKFEYVIYWRYTLYKMIYNIINYILSKFWWGGEEYQKF